ncbi:glutathione S-transferase [Trinickia caryophylli]|uniref:Glutathione S-transferase n=1 Tax=Trinickia caryophylli TaxID=28094 RepID=A0A1X7DDN8_TRICW|nr:glutathione S-transferase [Trinickia caryophylli]PMS09784.1 glutathione S-transferase [Trinickia caryophylli]TRX16848.1 glutathione S-transferase [Trinickia caryophylli]WQE12423.1 glutathione S-transferase [Trinickia caryophylli]SMF13600.1 Glutathione S-transferase [Trinickia caryophylli]GLU31428.1 glutathione S-transferase [Trinickia caryophylli]
MQLIGMLDSPYVRRVAISMTLLDLPFEHRAVSVFRHFDTFAAINPVVKAPTLVDDDGTQLIDSSLIVDYLDHRVAPERRLMPQQAAERRRALHLIGFALAACEKTVQIAYERNLRPADKQYEPWVERVTGQLASAYGLLERELAAGGGTGWLTGERIMQPDVTVAVAWRFTQHMLPGQVDAARHPALAAFSARAEALPAFVAAPLE